jgi:hypothetical protein
LYGQDIDPAPIESVREFRAFAEGILYGPAGRADLAARAKARAAEIQAGGATSLCGIPTATGRGTWSAVQVARVIERL